MKSQRSISLITFRFYSMCSILQRQSAPEPKNEGKTAGISPSRSIVQLNKAANHQVKAFILIKSTIYPYKVQQIFLQSLMTNVHGLRDLRNRNERDNEQPLLGGISQPPVAEQLAIAQQHRILFISGNKQIKNPKDESYFDMLIFALCPTYKFLSLTTLITLVNIGMFVFELSVGIAIPNDYFLDVGADTLIKYGGNYLPGVLNGQVYRLVSAIFLHVYFMHIFGNQVTIFMFLSRIEYTFGVLQTLVIYLVSGICGNIFSLACNPSNDVRAGASTALYGIIGVIMGYLVINWRGLDLVGPAMKCQLWCTAAMIIIFIFAFTPSGNIDFFGHVGGFLGGVWLSAIHQPIINETREKIIRGVFIGLLSVQLIATFLVVFLS